MTRILLAAGFLTLLAVPVTGVRADGIPDYDGRTHVIERPVNRIRPRGHVAPLVHLRRVRSFRSTHALLPSTLPTHPSLPLYNEPPQRFPEP